MLREVMLISRAGDIENGIDTILFMIKGEVVLDFSMFIDSDNNFCPAFVSYHSQKRIHDSDFFFEHCTATGGKCYSDGSGLAALDVAKTLNEAGPEAMWQKMESIYKKWIDGVDCNDTTDTV